MPKAQQVGHCKKTRETILRFRLDEESKGYIVRAAVLRHLNVSECIQAVVVPQARKEVEEAKKQTIVLTPDEQLTFWHALQTPQMPTKAQRELAELIRDEA
jgi:uncharacterized protein (DUF1778 family)